MRPLSCLMFGVALVVFTGEVAAQAASNAVTVRPDASHPDSVSAPAPIQDNSFLVEEAYNQDAGTVQHSSAFAHPLRGRDWTYSFTDEWAVRGQRHQLSATIPLVHVDGTPSAAWGLGDVALNYRYQVAGVDGGPIAVAPRLTLLVPTGRASDGLGAGATGIQLMLPASFELGSALVMHVNAGLTRVGHADAVGRRTPTTMNYTLAHSFVWLAAERVNLLFETTWNRVGIIDDTGARGHEQEILVSPGVRWSYDLPRHLQIVPGIAVPIGVGPSAGQRSLFFYLSFEHPY